jgi:hypothetical protein
METVKMNRISATVEDFVRKHIRSVWQLELLLLVKSSDRPLNPTEIANALYLTDETVSSGLKDFERSGLVGPSYVEPQAYVYAPRTPQLREAVEQTGKAYGERRVAIINLIFSTAN